MASSPVPRSRLGDSLASGPVIGNIVINKITNYASKSSPKKIFGTFVNQPLLAPNFLYFYYVLNAISFQLLKANPGCSVNSYKTFPNVLVHNFTYP